MATVEAAGGEELLLGGGRRDTACPNKPQISPRQQYAQHMDTLLCVKFEAVYFLINSAASFQIHAKQEPCLMGKSMVKIK